MMLSTHSTPASLKRFAKPEPGQGRTGIGLALLIFGGAAALHIYSVAFLKVDMTTAPDRKSTRLNSSHRNTSRMPSSA